MLPNNTDTIVSLFEQQAMKNPAALALVHGSQRLTYSQLDKYANGIASALLADYHLQKGDRVAFSFSQKPVAILSTILAILKIGCTYVPIDPGNPESRIRYLVDQAKPKLLITDALTKHVYDDFSLDVMDFSDNDYAKSVADKPDISVMPEDAAYIIFTSGSTGNPKAVEVTHKNLHAAFYAWQEAYELDDIACHLQVVGYAFDVFSGDWIRCLCSGAKLVLCPEDISAEPKLLYRLIQEERVECAEFLPGSLRKLMAYCEKEQLSLDTFKVMVCGSDKWYPREYFEFKQKLKPGARLINSYGTSETTIDTTYFEFTKDNMFLLDIVEQVPIGKPFQGMRAYVVDEEQELCDIDSIGELYIAGSGVSNGYINSPELNAEKFLKSCPFDAGPVYRTGDYARVLPTGDIEFLGRHDRQIKHKGKRIDLTEVEKHLLDIDIIADCAVIIQEFNEDGGIVCFVTLKDPSLTVAAEKLKGLATERLPAYMVPDLFRVIEHLPTSVNGKLDRRALYER